MNFQTLPTTFHYPIIRYFPHSLSCEGSCFSYFLLLSFANSIPAFKFCNSRAHAVIAPRKMLLNKSDRGGRLTEYGLGGAAAIKRCWPPNARRRRTQQSKITQANAPSVNSRQSHSCLVAPPHASAATPLRAERSSPPLIVSACCREIQPPSFVDFVRQKAEDEPRQRACFVITKRSFTAATSLKKTQS